MDQFSGSRSATIRTRLAEVIFPTVYPDPTAHDAFQASLFEMKDTSFDREAVRLVLAEAERQRREICSELEKQAQSWSATRAAELGGSDWWQQHCDTFAALALRRWTSASTALLQVKALATPSDASRPANDQLVALVAKREAELFGSATIRPDSDFPMTLKLTRATEKSRGCAGTVPRRGSRAGRAECSLHPRDCPTEEKIAARLRDRLSSSMDEERFHSGGCGDCERTKSTHDFVRTNRAVASAQRSISTRLAALASS